MSTFPLIHPILILLKVIKYFFVLFFRLNDLIEVFNDEGQSNYLVAFMRLLCSMQIKKEADLYINFLDGDTDVHTFCALEVEPMFKESDIVHIHALSKVEYFVLQIK